MSFGNLSKMLDKTSKILSNNTQSSYTLSNLSLMKNYVYKELQTDFSDVTVDIVDEIFNRLF